MSPVTQPPPRGLSDLAAVAGPALVVGLVSIATFWNLRELKNRDAWVTHTQRVELTASGLMVRLSAARAAQRIYLETGNTTDLVPYRAAKDSVRSEIAALRVLTRDRPGANPQLDSLEKVTNERLANLDSALLVRDALGKQAALTLPTDRARVLNDTVRAITSAIASSEEGLLTVRAAALSRQQSITLIVLAAGTVLAILLGLRVNSVLLHTRRRDAMQAARLREQATELELQNDQLHQQAIELELHAEQLEATAAEAHSANQAKSEFLTTMSHELRTPLNAIGGYAQLLEMGVRGPLSDDQRQDLRRIDRASAHLLALINDVLHVARLESGHVPLEAVRVTVKSVVAEACVMIAPQASSKGLTFVCEPGDEKLSVTGDRDRILQILINLLSNAVKFTPMGGHVTMRYEATPSNGTHDKQVTVTVTDTGRGIPHDQLHNVFEPFVQVGRTRSGTQEGAGLGLTISRDLARAMRGDLAVDSVEGIGSSFRLALPLACEGDVPADVPADALDDVMLAAFTSPR